MSVDPETQREIIIVRRAHRDEGDSHHGGVWKIAYADFMTAMMAFFLVMWLINAANEETKAAVASYFNPVKLMDRHSSARGMEDLNKTEGKIRFKSDEKIKDGTKVVKNLTVENPPEVEERQMFREPYAVLADIAHQTGVLQNHSEKGDGGAAISGTMTGAASGEAFRDPFSPDYWSSKAESDIIPIASIASKDADMVEVLLKQPVGDADKTDAQTHKTKVDSQPEAGAAMVKPAIDPKLADEIRDAVGAMPEKAAPDVTIVAADGGVMIQLTDKIDYAMFAIGSAKPDGRVVQILEKIAKILANRPGEVIVSGHTDARPFKNASYDNWRLSSARAQMAYYMLVRGGLDENRILRVEGYAARQPKQPANPNADENRRIEIFLKTAP